MKTLLFLAALLCSSVTHAQVDQEVKTLLNQIRAELNQQHDQRTLLRVRERLADTLELLTGSAPNPNPNPNPVPRSMVSCMARDNDGRDPWVLGVKDPITLQQTKLPSSNVGTFANCERIKPTVIQVQNSFFACVSRDNDARDPWAIVHYRDGKLISKVSNVGTLDQCLNILAHAYSNSQAIAFCAARDNDGRAPWIQMSVVAATGEVHRGGNYGSLEQCFSAKSKLKLD